MRNSFPTNLWGHRQDRAHSPMIKTIALFLISGACQLCLAGEDTNIIAMSDWSKPVATYYGHALRARMLISQEHSPAHAGPLPETEFYLELQNV